MNYFGLKEADFVAKGARYTAEEIWNQPEVWEKTYEKMLNEYEEVSRFRDAALKNSQNIILTGAGTSAFIGYSLEGSFLRNTGLTTTTIPTTHLVTHADDYFRSDIPVLVISFARSGNSPESVAALKLADKIGKHCYHLIITCDENGQLANYKSGNGKHNFILPAESNDKALAMTSSYTSMLLAGLLFARLDEIESLRKQVTLLKEYGATVLDKFGGKIQDIAKKDFERAVFLGSGPFYGTSIESHLKLQELTDGQIICKNDTFLAFRHGPKAVVNEKTVVFFLFSNKKSVQRYEIDFVNSMRKGKEAMLMLGVSESNISGVQMDAEICFSDKGKKMDEEFLAICSVLPAQMLGLFKSLDLGLSPDNPSVSGAISRVVEGVIIYDK